MAPTQRKIIAARPQRFSKRCPSPGTIHAATMAAYANGETAAESSVAFVSGKFKFLKPAIYDVRCGALVLPCSLVQTNSETLALRRCFLALRLSGAFATSLFTMFDASFILF